MYDIDKQTLHITFVGTQIVTRSYSRRVNSKRESNPDSVIK